MEITRDKTSDDVGRVTIAGEHYLRMFDLAHDIDIRLGLKGIGGELCRMFRKANSNVFFYREIDPRYLRGYYMPLNKLDALVHFCGENAEAARGNLNVKKKISNQVTAVKKPKSTTQRTNTDALEAKTFQSINLPDCKIPYIFEDGRMWIRARNFATYLRPGTSVYSTFGTKFADHGGTVRKLHDPKFSSKPSLFFPYDQLVAAAKLLLVGPQNNSLKVFRKAVEEILRPTLPNVYRTIPITTPATDIALVQAELAEVKAMLAQLVQANAR